jgi:hypothetical protein
MNIILIGYWIITTIITIGWFIKNPVHGLEDEEHFTLFDIIGNIFPAAILGWIMVPIMASLHIKFKR